MFKGLCEKMLFSFPVRFRYQFKILVLYEVKPSIIVSVLHPNSPSWILRPADGGLLVIPRICLETSGETVHSQRYHTKTVEQLTTLSLHPWLCDILLKNSLKLICFCWFLCLHLELVFGVSVKHFVTSLLLLKLYKYIFTSWFKKKNRCDEERWVRP